MAINLFELVFHLTPEPLHLVLELHGRLPTAARAYPIPQDAAPKPRIWHGVAQHIIMHASWHCVGGRGGMRGDVSGLRTHEISAILLTHFSRPPRRYTLNSVSASNDSCRPR